MQTRLLLRRTHGKCAEPEAISKWLFELEAELGRKSNSLTIEEAREKFFGTVSNAIEITKKVPIQHGTYKKACDSCNPLLEHFKITEIKL